MLAIIEHRCGEGGHTPLSWAIIAKSSHLTMRSRCLFHAQTGSPHPFSRVPEPTSGYSIADRLEKGHDCGGLRRDDQHDYYLLNNILDLSLAPIIFKYLTDSPPTLQAPVQVAFAFVRASMNPQFSQACFGCGKSFAQPSAFTNHQRYCQSSKKRMSSALASAKSIWEEKRSHKRHRHATVSEDLVPEAATITITSKNMGLEEPASGCSVSSSRRCMIFVLSTPL